MFTLVPLAFQGHPGLGRIVSLPVLDGQGNVVTPAVYSGMLAPDIYSGMGVARAMAEMVGGGAVLGNALVVCWCWR